MSSNTAELEGLLIGPYLWSGERYCSFVHDACIVMDTDEQFVRDLNAENDKVFGMRNCVETIGKEYWDILKYDQHGHDIYTKRMKKEENKKSVVFLLKLIRNEIEHIQQYSDDNKRKLNRIITNGRRFEFFKKDKNTAFILNKNQFMAFWIFKFPKLIPYLWLKFYKFETELTNYYPVNGMIMERFQKAYLDMDTYGKELKNALKCDLENGNVWKRFEKGHGNSSKRFKGQDCLEFREFNNISKILDTNEVIIVAVNSKDDVLLSVSHSSTKEDRFEYLGTASGTQKSILVFCDNVDDDEIWKYCRKCDGRIIVFSKQINLADVDIENAVTKFRNGLKECPIRGTELSLEKMDRVFEQSQVCVQGRDMKIKDIFADRSTLVGVLSGNLLNKLLKNEKPSLFGEYEYPEYKGAYVKRQLRGIFSIENRTGTNLDEEEFLKSISNKTNTVYIIADPGMGKSKLLNSFRKLLENSLVIYCTFRNFVDLLRNTAKTVACSKTDISSVILDILKCKNDCERNFANKWLDQTADKGVKIELQLDGLDEVSSENFKLAFKSLKIIRNDLQSIRLWVTSTEHVAVETMGLRSEYGNILPFSFEDKIKYFKMCWRQRYIGLDDTRLEEHICYLLNKLQLIPDLKMLNDFTDYPLSCSLLAELYADKVTTLVKPEDRPESQLIISSLGLYESLTNIKFANMIREKKGIELDENENDFKMIRKHYLHLHTYLALVHLFPEVANKFIEPFDLEFLRDECPKMGIITSMEPLGFHHLTYVDYLVAQYVIKVLGTGKLDNLCSKETFDNLLYFGTPDESSKTIRFSIWVFVDEYLDKLENWGDLKWPQTYNKSEHRFFESEGQMGEFLTGAIKYGIWNLTRLLINMWVNNKDSGLCFQIIHLALVSEAPSDWFKSRCQELMFNNQPELVLYCVEEGRFELAQYFIDIWCGKNILDKIAGLKKSRGGILHYIVNRIGTDFIPQPNIFIEEFKGFISYVHGKNGEEIKRKNRNRLSLLLALTLMKTRENCGITSEHISTLKKFLINDLNVDVNETTFTRESELCLGKYSETKDARKLRSLGENNAQSYHETLALLKSKNFAHINLKSRISGFTPLTDAVHFFGSKLRRDTLELFRDMGADFNETDKNGDTILHYCVKNNEKLTFIKMLVEYGCKIDVKNGNNLCTLCLAQKVEETMIHFYFCQKLQLRGDMKCELNCNKEKNQE